MSDIWSEIRSDYDKARAALWSPKGADLWQREEETGRYYLWKAYHRACEVEPKDELLFARILAMMAYESQITVFEYELYHKFVKPSLEAYERAMKAGQRPTEKELERIRFDADSFAYVLAQKNLPYEEQIRHIKGYEQLADFEFHDSKPVCFRHTDYSAQLKLVNGDIVVSLLFENLIDINVYGDPLTNWVEEFYCYPCFHNKDVLTFDIENYKIICSSISVEVVEQNKACE